MDIPDYRRPPKQPAAAIAQSRNWFLFNIDGEPQVYRRKAILFLVPGTNVREFVGDDYEPHGHIDGAKMPDGARAILSQAWQEVSKPPLFTEA